jgi:hypothetical protein
MRANIPPDLLAVVDAIGLDQQVDKRLVLRPVGIDVRDVGAREALKDFGSIRLEPVFIPSQKGEFDESARMWGRK